MKKLSFKKLMAMAVAVCMILSCVTAIPAFAETNGLYDVDFDNPADSDGVYTNEASSSYVFGYNSGASQIAPSMARVMDAKKGNNVLHITSNAPDNFYALGMMNYQMPAPTSMIVPGKVMWFELSFCYNELGRSWLNFGEYPFEITAAGEIFVGGLNGNATYNGVKVDSVTLEEGEWYHFVVAVDNIDKVGNESRIYAWMNGKFLETYETPYHGATCTKAYLSDPNHCLFYSFSTDLCLDDYKIYSTDEAVKVNGAYTFDPEAVMAGCDVTSSTLTVGNGTIGVPSKATLADVIATLSFDGEASYFDGDTKLEDMNVPAAGKTMYVASSTGVGVKKYALEDAGNIEIPEMEIITNYYDINFDNASDTDSTWKNNASSYAYSSTTIGYWPPATALVNDTVKGSKVLNVTSPAGASNGQFGCVGTRETGFSSFVDGKVVWHELSFKFNKFTRTYLNSGEYPFDISESGVLFIGGLEGNATYNGTAVKQLELGTWYHLVVAVDNIDYYAGAAGNEVRFYAWLDGEFVRTGETANHGATVSRTAVPSPGLYFLSVVAGANDVDLCIDDVKMFTTDKAVKEDGKFCFTPGKKVEGAQITSDTLRVENGVIYVSEDTTIADAVANISCDNTYFVFNGTTELDKASSEKAIGKVVHAQSDNNVGVLKYEFKKGSENDFVVSSASLKVNGAEDSVEDVKAGDSIVASVKVTASTSTGVVVFAVYENGELVACSIKNVADATDRVLESDAITVETAENISVSAFLWDGLNSIKPLTDTFEY